MEATEIASSKVHVGIPMHHYLTHLLSDIAYATQKVSWPFVEQEVDIHGWLSPEEEDNTKSTCHRRKLSDEQIHELLSALKTMPDAYNWSFVLQIEGPERIQYARFAIISVSRRK